MPALSVTPLTRDDVKAHLRDAPPAAQAPVSLLDARFSCRAYRSDPVPPDTIAQILALAQLSPSWSNVQPWQVLITSRDATRKFAEALYAHGMAHPADMDFDFDPPPGYEGVSDERRKECGIRLYTSLGIARGDKRAGFMQMQENLRAFGAPHIAIITSERKLGLYGAVDCGGYVSNFLLAATSFGIASIPQAALARYGSFVRDYFAVPNDRVILCGISFGYAQEDHPANMFRTVRASTDEIVQFVDS